MYKTANMKKIDQEMSNFDSSIDDGMSEALMSEPGMVFGYHSAWNFNGKVYYEEGKYHEEVWVYHELKEIISAETLEELMEEVNLKYGDE